MDAPLGLSGENPRVGIFVRLAQGYNRGIVRGVLRYAESHGPWQVFVETLLDIAVQDIARVPPVLDGLIVDVLSQPELQPWLEKTDLPTVDVSPDVYDPPLPRCPHIVPDDFSAGSAAAAYFLNLGFKRFGFVGFPTAFSTRREQGFVSALAVAGYGARTLVIPQASYGTARLEREEGRLAEFMRNLPKPAALFIVTDMRARDVLHNARRIGIGIPEELAVLAVDNDPLVCETLSPPLSSIPLDGEGAGHRAARLLDGMMTRVRAKGRAAPTHWRAKTILMRPLAPVTRGSSDVLAIADADVAAAVQLIRERAVVGLALKEVYDLASISRRSLEKRFYQHLGRSPGQEIWRVRIEKAQSLLATSALSIKEVAFKAGFGSPEHLAIAFRRKLGQSPSDYRRMNTAGGNSGRL
jgi:LacI family transcriptional regulator